MGKQKKYSNEYKEELCKKYFEEGISQGILANEAGCSKSVIHRWIKKYENGGIEELSTNNRGKSTNNKGRSKTKFDSVEEELNYVKAERDVLKKFLEIQRRSIKK